MKKSTKVIELFIDDLDDLEQGVSFISIVDSPAIKRSYMKFNEDEEVKILSPDMAEKMIEFLDGNNFQTKDILKYARILKVEKIEDGEKIYDEYKKLKKIKDEQFVKKSLIKPNPDEDSVFDFGIGDDRKYTRFYYEGPVQKPNTGRGSNREFCYYMMTKHRNSLFRYEDIVNMSLDMVNDMFNEYYSIYNYRGGYGCRHRWVRIVYQLNNNGRRINPELPTPNGPAEIVSTPPNVIPTINDGDLSEAFSVKCSCGEDHKKVGQFKIQNKEQQILLGPVAIPKEPIIRYDDKGEPFFVYFSTDTIRKMSEKFMRDGNLKNIDINHNNEVVKDSYVVQSWLVESDKDKIYEFYDEEEIPIGTWCVSVKINNPEVWKNIKDETYGLSGFSIEGSFNQRFSEDKDDLTDDELLEEARRLLGMVK